MADDMFEAMETAGFYLTSKDLLIVFHRKVVDLRHTLALFPVEGQEESFRGRRGLKRCYKYAQDALNEAMTVAITYYNTPYLTPILWGRHEALVLDAYEAVVEVMNQFLEGTSGDVGRVTPVRKARLESLDAVIKGLERAAGLPATTTLGSGGDETLGHSDDYRTVRWNGEQFEFSPMQAACVRALHGAHMQSLSGLSGEEVLRQADSEQTRLDRIFWDGYADHPAWGRLVCQSRSGRKGIYKLAISG